MRSNEIHQSLQEKKLVSGIDQKLFVFIWLIGVAFTVVYGYYLMAVGSFVIHMFFRWVYKNDPDTLEVYLRYRMESDVYDPWPRSNSEVKRPKGFGRDLLC